MFSQNEIALCLIATNQENVGECFLFFKVRAKLGYLVCGLGNFKFLLQKSWGFYCKFAEGFDNNC